MSAPAVAKVIGRIHEAMWLPRIASWEIAETDGRWGAHGELAAEDSVAAVMALTKLASEVGSELVDKDRLFTVDFAQGDVPVRVWWLRPVVPVAHATAAVVLRELAQSEHELTGARLALWEEEQETRQLREERHATNEALDDAVKAIREKDERLADLEAERAKLVRWHAEDTKQLAELEREVAAAKAPQGSVPAAAPARRAVSADSFAARLARVLSRQYTDVVTAKPVDALTLDLTVQPADLARWEWWLIRISAPAGQTTLRGSYATAKGQFGRTRVLLTGLGVGALHAAERDRAGGVS